MAASFFSDDEMIITSATSGPKGGRPDEDSLSGSGGLSGTNVIRGGLLRQGRNGKPDQSPANDLFADRTSTRIMSANQLRLCFSAFAHLLVELLQEGVLKKTFLASATIGTIRLRFFKVAARVKVSTRRVLVEWSSACPNRRDYQLAHAALSG